MGGPDESPVYRGPGILEPTEVADPVPEPGEVVLEVAAAGVCGTDHHLVAGELGVPDGTIPGHEIAGRVLAAGSGVEDWAVGDMVVSYGQVVCGTCHACRGGHENRCSRPEGLGVVRPGGFSELVAIPARYLVSLPTGVDAASGRSPPTRSPRRTTPSPRSAACKPERPS